MRKFLFTPAIAFYFAASSISVAHAQTTCGQAITQLQGYIASVNQFANNEYFQGIPMRCGHNPGCQQWWLQQLNGWYMNQSGMVNNWYMQIQARCSSEQGKEVGQTSDGGAPSLDEEEVANLEVDDEDRTVRIKIPSDAVGYKGKRSWRR
jgi:hypothetical protein